MKSRAAVFHGAGQPLEVREIDLDEPGTWTSGRNEQDSALVADAEAQRAQQAEQAAEEAPVEQQRAVGS